MKQQQLEMELVALRIELDEKCEEVMKLQTAYDKLYNLADRIAGVDIDELLDMD